MNIGLDLSLTETGWYFIAPGIEEGGVLKPGKLMGVERLANLRGQLSGLIARCNKLHPIERVVIEGYAFGAKNKREAIGEWGGVARLCLADHNLSAYTVQPTSLKQFVTGKGNSQKDEVMLQIYKRWGREFRNNNIADAFALAAVGVAMGTKGEYHAIFQQDPTAIQATAVGKVEQILKTTPRTSGIVRVRTRNNP